MSAAVRVEGVSVRDAADVWQTAVWTKNVPTRAARSAAVIVGWRIRPRDRPGWHAIQRLLALTWECAGTSTPDTGKRQKQCPSPRATTEASMNRALRRVASVLSISGRVRWRR